ncbi:hypothetical protein LLG39_00200, partial [bacterium]|nr:hypothetical protein [bacterium]
MSFSEQFHNLLHDIDQSRKSLAALMERFNAEISFARAFADALPEKKSEWESLIVKSVEHVSNAISTSGAIDVAKAVTEAEGILAPIGKVAKDYTIHCCGHAHIDMNWMWPWQDTVSVTHDTFSTVNKLMDEFPEFHFSQSQASTYKAMEQY